MSLLLITKINLKAFIMNISFCRYGSAPVLTGILCAAMVLLLSVSALCQLFPPAEYSPIKPGDSSTLAGRIATGRLVYESGDDMKSISGNKLSGSDFRQVIFPYPEII